MNPWERVKSMLKPIFQRNCFGNQVNKLIHKIGKNAISLLQINLYGEEKKINFSIKTKIKMRKKFIKRISQEDYYSITSFSKTGKEKKNQAWDIFLGFQLSTT